MTNLPKPRTKNGEGHLEAQIASITPTPTPTGDFYLPTNQGNEHSSNTHHTYRKRISYMKKSNEGVRKAWLTTIRRWWEMNSIQFRPSVVKGLIEERGKLELYNIADAIWDAFSKKMALQQAKAVGK
jgi:hypothetical protein